MNSEPKALTDVELLELFKSRGMEIEEVLPQKLAHINYYRLKSFAYPLANISFVDNKKVISYEGLKLVDIIGRYYQDKNLRIHLMHAIEKVEVSIKTNLARILGRKYGAFGYLNFNRWANRQRISPYVVEEKQYRIKKNLLKTLRKSSHIEINDECNLNGDSFPSVWIGLDLLTFGDVITMIEILNDKILRELSKVYQASPEELVSWLTCLQFVRNICAHNDNLVDLRLQTKPKCRKVWNHILYQNVGKDGSSKTPTNRLALIICIVVTLVHSINPKYQFKNIYNCVRRLCKVEKDANLLGFNSLRVVTNIEQNISLSKK